MPGPKAFTTDTTCDAAQMRKMYGPALNAATKLRCLDVRASDLIVGKVLEGVMTGRLHSLGGTEVVSPYATVARTMMGYVVDHVVSGEIDGDPVIAYHHASPRDFDSSMSVSAYIIKDKKLRRDISALLDDYENQIKYHGTAL